MKFLLSPVLLFSLLLLSACSDDGRREIDWLNDLSFASHYRNIDSTAYYAERTLAQSEAIGYADGQAMALNNLAFVNIIKMDYDAARQALDAIPTITDNQIELLVGYVQQMRLCQRRSSNREFYDYRERAQQAQRRIDEERSLLDAGQRRRLLYAETELAIVNSTYYYYIGLERQSVEAMQSIPQEVANDTVQLLNYLYNVGAGGVITEGTQRDINQQEFDCLLRCLQLSRQHHYPYFEANAQEALAEHLTDAESREQLLADNAPAVSLINPENISAEELPVWLAGNALTIFQTYGDVYQTAGAYRTLASCYLSRGNYQSALDNLKLALADSAIYQAPDLVASIREQFSVAYAAIDDKAQSDENRNLYLDLQEQTRQDRQLEARADQLDRAVTQLNWILALVCAAILLLLFLLWLFNHLNKKQRHYSELDEQLEEKQEELAMKRLHIEKAERINLEQRAKVSLVSSITPLIDRMLHEVKRLSASDSGHRERLDYICELADQINTDNNVLTHWIQLQQGEVHLRIGSFPLQPLFDILNSGKMSFQLRGITLNVEPTHALVKADRILTLFMLNTLADNARKATPEGGQVTIRATEGDNYVEVSVIDTGTGMSQEKLEHLFDAKPIHEATTPSLTRQQPSHGFGLLNCKGIIEKYRKLSQIFSVCTIQAESREGHGSRLFFRLPKGIARTIVAVVAATLSAYAAPPPTPAVPASPQHPLTRAGVFADSAYFSNINGTYQRTLLFADSCLQCLNEYYLQQYPGGNVLMMLDGDVKLTPPEIIWLHDSLPTNYSIILDIRNESAVAALALHQWQLYQYNNRIYTTLFKELSADDTLTDYCRGMQQSQTNKTIALTLLVLILIAIVPAYYFVYLRPKLNARYRAEKLRQSDIDALDDNLRRADFELSGLHVANAVLDNCLSALKHETMYYPSRIQQLATQGDATSLKEVTAYYRELYALLSEQAMRQVEHVKLHLKALDNGILGDESLTRYLFEILAKQGGSPQARPTFTPLDENYMEVRVDMPQLKLTSSLADTLFTPATDHIAYLLCRQIVRDHGEAANRRRCSIRAEVTDSGQTAIVIILPRAQKSQTSIIRHQTPDNNDPL